MFCFVGDASLGRRDGSHDNNRFQVVALLLSTELFSRRLGGLPSIENGGDVPAECFLPPKGGERATLATPLAANAMAILVIIEERVKMERLGAAMSYWLPFVQAETSQQDNEMALGIYGFKLRR
jgi:hypothetical protein